MLFIKSVFAFLIAIISLIFLVAFIKVKYALNGEKLCIVYGIIIATYCVIFGLWTYLLIVIKELDNCEDTDNLMRFYVILLIILYLIAMYHVGNSAVLVV